MLIAIRKDNLCIIPSVESSSQLRRKKGISMVTVSRHHSPSHSYLVTQKTLTENVPTSNSNLIASHVPDTPEQDYW